MNRNLNNFNPVKKIMKWKHRKQNRNPTDDKKKSPNIPFFKSTTLKSVNNYNRLELGGNEGILIRNNRAQSIDNSAPPSSSNITNFKLNWFFGDEENDNNNDNNIDNNNVNNYDTNNN